MELSPHVKVLGKPAGRMLAVATVVVATPTAVTVPATSKEPASAARQRVVRLTGWHRDGRTRAVRSHETPFSKDRAKGKLSNKFASVNSRRLVCCGDDRRPERQ